MSLFIQWISVFIGGFVIGFVREWRLTLLLVGFSPILAISAAVFSKVSPMSRDTCTFLVTLHKSGSEVSYAALSMVTNST